MNKHLVFVYGTLRSGSARGMLSRFPTSKFISDAKVSGRLYDLGPYPGLVVNQSRSLVVGELYEVDDETLNELDAFEISSNYRRKQIKISLVSGETICWTYEPDPEFYSLDKLITSGDWLEYAKNENRLASK
jgi:gamma-glutamylcyclotransferase (GGCT)/AIG2-like uncharacterized protein YtfP